MAKHAPSEQDNTPTDNTDEMVEQGDEIQTVESTENKQTPAESPKKFSLKRLRPHWPPSKKQLLITGAVLAIVILVGLVPITRNVVFGLFFKTNLSVEAYDEIDAGNSQKAKVQLTDITVKIDGTEKNSKTNSPVLVTNLKPGNHTVEISKSNYKTSSQKLRANLAIGKQKNSLSVKLEATGIPTKYKVTNFITDDPVKGVNLSVGESKATTDEKGLALIILPIQKDKKYKVSLSGDGYNSKTEEVELNKQDSLSIVPTGKVYFLSKSSGKIDVVKTNLDGSERQTVLAGTGTEDDSTTTMISTTDWKHLALSTHRADKKNQLILINTADDSQTTMDEGNANFTLLGWDGKKLVYQSENLDIPYNVSGRYKIKAYDAGSQGLSVYYQTDAEGSSAYSYSSEYFSDVRIVNHHVLYSVSGKNYSDNGRIFSTAIESGDKKELHSYAKSDGYMSLIYTSAKEAYYSLTNYKDGQNNVSYFEVDENNNWKSGQKPATTNQFTYFVSPDAKRLLWSEERDGKQTVLLGDEEAKNPQKIYSLSELQPYAWFTDQYALYSKKGSELYIAGLKENSTPKKISDYHRPSAVVFRGYGGGGGGPY